MTRTNKDSNTVQAHNYARTLGITMSELRFLAHDILGANLRPDSWIAPTDQSRLRGALKSAQEEPAEDTSGYVSFCGVCFEPMDYCQGHGEIGDPEGHELRVLLDRHEGVPE